MDRDDFYERYARIVTQLGMNVQPDQEVLIRAPVEAVEFVPAVAAECYKLGARYVQVFYSDQQLLRARLEHARAETLEFVPEALIDERIRVARAGGAMLAILGEDPMGLDGVDPTRHGTVNKAIARATSEYRELAMKDHFPWCVVSVPNPAWAARVYPNLNPAQALQKLFDAVARACRLDQPDPVAAWQEHSGQLMGIAAWLTEQQFEKFVYTGPGTDLSVGMPENHVWIGTEGRSATGVTFIANLPTDEVFSAPDWRRVEGTVQSTRPLVLSGVNVGNATFTVEGGRIIAAECEGDQAMLEQELELDDRARYFGELALVSEDAPIAREQTTFFDGLYDENAGCHLAFGNAYATCLAGGGEMSATEKSAAGLNTSMQHHDFTVGSDELSIRGYRKDGSSMSIMEQGRWSQELLGAVGR
jgi:aminopeptidase